MLSVAPWFGTGLTFFRELCYLTVVAFLRQGIIIMITSPKKDFHAFNLVGRDSLLILFLAIGKLQYALAPSRLER